MNGRLNRIRYARLLIAALLVAVIAPSHAVPSNRIGPIAPLPKFEHTPSFPRQASDPVAGVADYPGICNPTSVGPSLGAYTTVGTEVFDTDALTYGGLPGPLSVALLALIVDGEPSPSAKRYVAEELTDRAIAFIETHRDRPFALYLAHKNVHHPFTPDEPEQGRYRTRAIDLPIGVACGPTPTTA